jgi:hypothetical protein
MNVIKSKLLQIKEESFPTVATSLTGLQQGQEYDPIAAKIANEKSICIKNVCLYVDLE